MTSPTVVAVDGGEMFNDVQEVQVLPFSWMRVVSPAPVNVAEPAVPLPPVLLPPFAPTPTEVTLTVKPPLIPPLL